MKMKIISVVIASLLVSLLCDTGHPARAASDRAKVLDVYGVAQKRVGSWRAPLRRLNSGDLLTPGSYIKTGSNAAVLLQLTGRHVLRVGNRTTVELRRVGAGRVYSFKVFAGQVWSKVQSAAKPARYEIETPSAVVGVSGTLFSVFYDRATTRTTVSTDEGVVRVRQGAYSGRVAKGFVARLRRGRVEGLNTMQPTSDVAQVWTLLRRQESWMKSGGRLRLDRRLEKSLEQSLSQLRLPVPRVSPRPVPRSEHETRRRGRGDKGDKGNKGNKGKDGEEQRDRGGKGKRDNRGRDDDDGDDDAAALRAFLGIRRDERRPDERRDDARRRNERRRDERRRNDEGRRGKRGKGGDGKGGKDDEKDDD